MLNYMNVVERTCHATMLYHHGSDTRTIAACVRGLQGFRERWTAPTIMCGLEVEHSARMLERSLRAPTYGRGPSLDSPVLMNQIPH